MGEKMRKCSSWWLAILLLTSVSAYGDIGLGVILGAPTGFSGVVDLQRKGQAIDAAIAWDLSDDHVHLHSDYLWIRSNDIVLEQTHLDWYFGIGGRLVFFDEKDNDGDDYSLGIRGPIGLSHTFADPKIEIFGELALIMDFIEETDVDIDFGIGARFHF